MNPRQRSTQPSTHSPFSERGGVTAENCFDAFREEHLGITAESLAETFHGVFKNLAERSGNSAFVELTQPAVDAEWLEENNGRAGIKEDPYERKNALGNTLEETQGAVFVNLSGMALGSLPPSMQAHAQVLGKAAEHFSSLQAAQEKGTPLNTEDFSANLAEILESLQNENPVIAAYHQAGDEFTTDATYAVHQAVLENIKTSAEQRSEQPASAYSVQPELLELN